MTNSKKDWREDFDSRFLRVGTKILLGVDNEEVGESMAIQIKDFIEQVEANTREEERREMAESIIEWVEMNQEGQWEDDNGVIHWYLDDLLKSIKSKYLTNKDE